MLLLETILGVTLAVWCAIGIFTFWNYRGGFVLRAEQAAQPLSSAPKVSIIVAARNEEEALPAALESLLRLDYPDYEVILVNDDSTDRTGLIADNWARRPQAMGRLIVIHNRKLPPGWTGKVHALSLAVRAASGEWILATDADVIFHPALLRLAVARALREGAQLLSLAPEIQLRSFADKVVLPAFSLFLTTLFPLRLVNHPSFPRALAAGAFILMSRADLEALGGYERLRKTVIEDVRMAELFKQNGRRIRLDMTRDLFRTRAYGSWQGIREALSRSAFEGAGFSVAKIMAGVVVGNILCVLPSATLLARLICDARLGQPSKDNLALALALGTCIASFLVYLPFLIFFRVSPLYVFALPLATVFYSAVSLNSAWQSAWGGGIHWKGRRYRTP